MRSVSKNFAQSCHPFPIQVTNILYQAIDIIACMYVQGITNLKPCLIKVTESNGSERVAWSAVMLLELMSHGNPNLWL